MKWPSFFEEMRTLPGGAFTFFLAASAENGKQTTRARTKTTRAKERRIGIPQRDDEGIYSTAKGTTISNTKRRRNSDVPEGLRFLPSRPKPAWQMDILAGRA